MSAILDIGETGATLSIPDADGEAHAYLVQPAPPGLDEWACSLERAGEDGHGPYRVAVSRGGAWRCSCESWTYKKKADRPKGCKHSRAVKSLLAFMRRVMGKGETDAV